MVIAIYKGKDNSMGLHTNEVYCIKSEIKQDLLWVTWKDNSCPYPSLEKFLENWEVMSANELNVHIDEYTNFISIYWWRTHESL